MRRVPPMNGKTMLGVYVLISNIGNPAKAVSMGFTLALRGFRSSYAPISPAITTVPKKLINNQVFSGFMRIPPIMLTTRPTMMTIPPISGTRGRLSLCTSVPTIPLFFNSFRAGGMPKRTVRNPRENMARSTKTRDISRP